MEAPRIGSLELDPEFDWYQSQPIRVSMLSDRPCVFVLEEYADDASKDDFHAAIANILDADPEVLHDVTRHVHQYFLDANDNIYREDDDLVVIDDPVDVWKHVELGDEIHLKRRHRADKSVYATIECNCDWEVEHGLQLVLKNGARVTKIGPYDGHLTNSDAYADATFEDVVYVRVGQ